MGYKLFVDDTRDIPRGFLGARTYDDCLRFFRLFDRFEVVSLDYSLNEKHNGLDILIYMKENGFKPERINIHSNHIEGRVEMKRYAEENFPDVLITTNMLYK